MLTYDMWPYAVVIAALFALGSIGALVTKPPKPSKKKKKDEDCLGSSRPGAEDHTEM